MEDVGVGRSNGLDVPHKSLTNAILWGILSDMAEDNIIKETLVEELDRNMRSRRAYELECAKLPRGSVTVRTRGNRAYCYLKYREGDRTVTEYAGVAEKVEDELRRQVSRRKELESVVKRLDREESFIRKALRHS